MTYNQALKKAQETLKSIVSHRIDSTILILEVLKQKNPGINQAWLLANGESILDAEDEKEFFKLVKRRVKFEPIAFIINRKEFYGRDFYVDKRVLIPRPETEILVEKAVEVISQLLIVNCQLSLLELGTGSGCITISVIKELEQKGIDLAKFSFTATDISKKALEVAQKNAKIHQIDNKITFLQSDLFDFVKNLICKLPATTYNLILANLPYVPAYWLTESPSEFGLIHEPKVAIEGGQSGLELIDRFFSQIFQYLAKDGTIISEFGDDQKDELIKMIKKYLPSAQISVFNDYQNLPRIASIKI